MATGEKSAMTPETSSSESSTVFARRISAGQTRLAKDVFDFAEDAAVLVFFARRGLDLLIGQRGGELFEELLLVLRQLLGRDRLDGHQQIAVAAAGDVGHALAAQPERGAGLRALRHLDGFFA